MEVKMANDLLIEKIALVKKLNERLPEAQKNLKILVNLPLKKFKYTNGKATDILVWQFRLESICQKIGW
ncbi:MAG: hypothetical protein V1851_02315 [Patescibacteria group bacterium]